MLACPIPLSFLNIHCLYILFIGCKTLYIFINFLVIWFVCQSPFLVHFKNGTENLK